VTADTLQNGVTAHDKSGTVIVGTAIRPEGTMSITENGSGIDVAQYASVDVNVSGSATAVIRDTIDAHGGTIREITTDEEIYIEPLSITSNGTYTASSGHAYDEVTVNVEGGGGFTVDEIAMRTISGTISGSATTIGAYAFYNCSALAEVSFPLCTTIGAYAFYTCSALTEVSFPLCTSIGASAFQNCSALAEVSFPSCTTIGAYAFYTCSALTEVSFPLCTSIYASAFQNCSALTTAVFSNSSTIQGIIYTYAFQSCYHLLSLYLLANTLYQLSVSSTTFVSTPIGGYTTSTDGVYGSIFVPASLYDAYISSTNWSYFSERFVSLTDTEIQNVLDYGTHNPT